jgi:carboxylate-amine ligase
MSDYPLFSVVGVEMEYMIVDQHDHRVRALLPDIFCQFNDPPPFDIEQGDMAWSNELAAHIIEFKTNGPASQLAPLSEGFHQQVQTVNGLLAAHGAQLMPGGVHPLMNPATETVLWPYESRDVYDTFDRMFHCQGHGWSNLQSTHINLPFANDKEFAKLHGGIRALLPLLPTLTAASPYLDGKFTGFTDTRLEVYRHNQKSMPIIAGHIIPEAVFSERDYQQQILDPIARIVKPYDTANVLDPLFVNSRGAIARFDRGSIEIRLIDNQEAPCVDIALVDLIICVLKHWCDNSDQRLLQNLPTLYLADILLQSIRYGTDPVIDRRDYLAALLLEPLPKRINLHDLWHCLFEQHQASLQASSRPILQALLKHGNLASRLIARVGQQPSVDDLHQMCRSLTNSLASNQMLV